MLDGKAFGAFRLTTTRDGVMLYNPLDRYIGTSVERYGEFSYFEAELFAALCAPGDTVFDVGANIGAHTVALARLVGPGGFVYAFEPLRVIFNVLCANVALNGLENVEGVHAVVGRTPGEEFIPEIRHDESGNFGSFDASYFGAGRPVRRVTLDAFANVERLTLVKIDIEGMEGEAIAGAHDLIARHRPVLYVENDRRDRSPALIAQLFALGYRLFWHLAPLFNPDNYRAEAENVFPGIVSVNMLCVPRERADAITGFREIRSPEDQSGVG
ncbi:MAG: FkbM family methyltransferase [Candidatus Velthaea sp.]